MNSTTSVEEMTKENVLALKGVGVHKLPKYTVISCKCTKCALHYKIYTEHPKKWQKLQKGIILGAYCPECGSKGAYTLSWITKQGWIFQEYPEGKPLSDADYTKIAKELTKRYGVETR